MHTPGPWEYEHASVDLRVNSDTDGGGWVSNSFWIQTPAHVLICDTHSFAFDEPNDEFYKRVASREEAEANARLIAAAPELLEALDTLLREEHRDDDDPILNAAREQARAALAKAAP